MVINDNVVVLTDQLTQLRNPRLLMSIAVRQYDTACI